MVVASTNQRAHFSDKNAPLQAQELVSRAGDRQSVDLAIEKR